MCSPPPNSPWESLAVLAQQSPDRNPRRFPDAAFSTTPPASLPSCHSSSSADRATFRAAPLSPRHNSPHTATSDRSPRLVAANRCEEVSSFADDLLPPLNALVWTQSGIVQQASKWQQPNLPPRKCSRSTISKRSPPTVVRANYTDSAKYCA